MFGKMKNVLPVWLILIMCFVIVAVNATATLATTLTRRLAESSVNVTTSLVIVTTRFCAQVPIMVSANADHASATMDGVEMHVNAVTRLIPARHRMEIFALVTEVAFVVAVSVKSRMTLDTLESIAKSAQHVPDAVTNSKTALNVRCTRRDC